MQLHSNMAKYSFTIDEDTSKAEWWVVSVRNYPGFELRFKNLKFNTTKQLQLPSNLGLDRYEAEDILREMIKWLTLNHYELLLDASIPSLQQPLSDQFVAAMECAGMDETAVSEAVGCKLSRIKHLMKGKYNTINLEMFEKAVEALGYEISLHKKVEPEE